MCECGCGEKAPISPVNLAKLGYVKGEPRRFIRGHATKGKRYVGDALENIIQANRATRFQKGHLPLTDGSNLVGLQAGNTHWNWKGGVTPEKKSLRDSAKYALWRTSIFERDNYTCVTCNKRGVYLEADHFPRKFIEVFNEKNWELMWDISNGRTLCKECHNDTKRKKG